jgi:hypothetical protein
MIASLGLTPNDLVNFFLLVTWYPSVTVVLIIKVMGYFLSCRLPEHFFSRRSKLKDRITLSESVFHLFENIPLVVLGVAYSDASENEDAGACGCRCFKHLPGRIFPCLLLRFTLVLTLILLFLCMFRGIVNWVWCIITRGGWTRLPAKSTRN